MAVLLLLGVTGMLHFETKAVTDSEMDQAKAIAAKFYIRYVNDGAGYLDNWTPSSMSDLEKKLTTDKDRQSLRDFKSASVASDYASWDKARLVAYWSGEFFTQNASKLDSKGASNSQAKQRIKTSINNMKVTAPAAAQPPVAQETPELASEVINPETVDPGVDPALEETIAENLEDVENELAEAGEQLNEEENAQEVPVIEKKESSGTWVYIMVLGILIVIVICLVVYASRTMKGQAKIKSKKEEKEEEERETDKGKGKEKEKREEDDEYSPRVAQYRPSISDETKMREKYAETLAAKSEEIRTLNRQLSEMEALAARLKDDNRRLVMENEQLRGRRYERIAAPTQTQAAAPVVPTPAHTHAKKEGEEKAPAAAHRPAPAANDIREIYLGRVNSKGLFVRADRHAVDGQSIYKLSTHNGVSGTYSLINNPLIEEQVLDDPGKWLAGGCFAKDIFDTNGREHVRTETPGTAVFKDGAWRVERKAKIRYE